MMQYEMYVYVHPDGRVKHWAYRVTHTGEIEVRWGPENRLSQHKLYPASASRKVQETASAKVRKGYRHVGQRELDRSGSLMPKAVSPVDRTTIVNKAVLGVTPPPPPPPPRLPAFDLSQIDTEIPDIGWF